MNFIVYIRMAVSTLFAKGRRNPLKIFTLALGLAVGLVLAAKVCFEQTYDDFYENADRIFYISEAAEQNGEFSVYAQTSGGTAPMMKEHYPEIEEASRITFFESEASLIDVQSKTRYSAHSVMMADSCFFKILDRKCLAGNITGSLGIKNNIVVSERMARAMAASHDRNQAAQEVIGRQFTIGSRGEDVKLTVAGVYEEFPANSNRRPDVLISLPSIGQFMYDGSMDLVGNDRYFSYLKFREGVDGNAFNAKIDSYVQKYLPVEEMKQASVWLTYSVKPLEGMHTESPDVRNTMLVLGIVALALLLVSVLNYMLIVISTSVTRSREMALRKCLGGSAADTAKMMFAEALVHTLAATLLAAAMLFAGKGFVENFLGIGLADLFTGKPLALASGILVLVVCLNGIVPTELFNRIPVATAFRNYRTNRRAWKMFLLIVEFALVAFLCVLIGAVSVQYDRMTGADLGFSYENTAELATPEGNPAEHMVLIEELRAMPEVEDACFAYLSLFGGFSGNNVRMPDTEEELFNAQDRYYVDDHWFKVMDIDIVEGRNFNPELVSDSEVIVDTRFAETLKTMTGWDDVIGRRVNITEHGNDIVIVGVVEPIDIGSFSKANDYVFSRPMAYFYCNPSEPMGRYHYPYQFIRYHRMTSETLARTREVTETVLPGQATFLNPLRIQMLEKLRDTLETKNTIIVGGFITLLIAIMGLIGYVVDEIKRRAKEIAVRRINGAQFARIRSLFLRDTFRIAVPSVLFGCVSGFFAALRWEQNFTMQVGVPWWIMLAAAVFTIGTVALVTDLFVTRMSNSNPAESIKTE